MQELQTFNFEELPVRTLEVDGEPYFIGKDVADILGYTNSRKALSDHVDEEDKLTSRIVTAGQNRNVTIINESGLYSLIFSSKLENAKRFKRWVTSEVLPTLRKTGAYQV
ncbi:TPA: Bro-N domain-containing protein, partial [Staphylococcus aureus]|nr:Bro-N domain-containing protein [Staphylococcus aureus]